MRILLLVHSFNGLAQRLFVELGRDGHELSVELDIHDRVTEEAVALYRPALILAPFLKRAIPATVWKRHRCLIVHPGPPGDRGPSALDWAILRGLRGWGVTVLQAVEEMDAGPVWASHRFAMRAATKSSLYRQEVSDGAVIAVRAAIGRIESGKPPLNDDNRGLGKAGEGWQPTLTQADRKIDWTRDDSATVLRKIRSADGFPGLEDVLFGLPFRIFDARNATRVSGPPGVVIGQRHGAVCKATLDGAVWIGQLQPDEKGRRSFKRPAVLALGALAQSLPEIATDASERVRDALGESIDANGCGHGHGDVSGDVDVEGAGENDDHGEIRYRESGAVGYLHFDFYNGALSVTQCDRLRAAYARAKARPTRVIVLMGGADFWCNGMHLHCIEAAESPAEASWDNIDRIDDFAHDILTTDSHLTMAALQGNAAAGGVFLALAADRVIARSNVVLNPHYRNMGNLYGSEYWTHLLPLRVGAERALELMASRLPLGADEAKAMRLIDAVAGPDQFAFIAAVESAARRMAEGHDFEAMLRTKRARLAGDEYRNELAACRADELERMRMNFFGFDPSYHIARHRFVHHAPLAWTPLHLARHRRAGFLAELEASPA